MVIGITGGVGCGKSTVCEYINLIKDSIIIDTDSIAKSLTNKGTDTYKEIVDCFGEDILDSNKEIDREKLSKIVFNDKESLIKLNTITHTKTIDIVKDIINKNKDKLIIVESALLLETALSDLCDEKWFVTASYVNRKQRLMSSRGYSIQRIDSMIASQKDDKYYEKLVDVKIVNNNLENMKKQVKDNLLRLML